jgi:hypothetical protein
MTSLKESLSDVINGGLCRKNPQFYFRTCAGGCIDGPHRVAVSVNSAGTIKSTPQLFAFSKSVMKLSICPLGKCPPFEILSRTQFGKPNLRRFEAVIFSTCFTHELKISNDVGVVEVVGRHYVEVVCR